jgi:uncharacterized protein GlcG (DUF336 family)
MENSFRKAYTARTFRIPSGEMEERLKKNPQMGAQYLIGFTTTRGALPIKIGDEVIGAAGVSGSGQREGRSLRTDRPRKSRRRSQVSARSCAAS